MPSSLLKEEPEELQSETIGLPVRVTLILSDEIASSLLLLAMTWNHQC